MLQYKLYEILVTYTPFKHRILRKIVERASPQYLFDRPQEPSSSAIASVMLKCQRLMPQLEQYLLEGIILDNAPVVQHEMLS